MENCISKYDGATSSSGRGAEQVRSEEGELLLDDGDVVGGRGVQVVVADVLDGGERRVGRHLLRLALLQLDLAQAGLQDTLALGLALEHVCHQHLVVLVADGEVG